MIIFLPSQPLQWWLTLADRVKMFPTFRNYISMVTLPMLVQMTEEDKVALDWAGRWIESNYFTWSRLLENRFNPTAICLTAIGGHSWSTVRPDRKEIVSARTMPAIHFRVSAISLSSRPDDRRKRERIGRATISLDPTLDAFIEFYDRAPRHRRFFLTTIVDANERTSQIMRLLIKRPNLFRFPSSPLTNGLGTKKDYEMKTND